MESLVFYPPPQGGPGPQASQKKGHHRVILGTQNFLDQFIQVPRTLAWCIPPETIMSSLKCFMPITLQLCGICRLLLYQFAHEKTKILRVRVSYLRFSKKSSELEQRASPQVYVYSLGPRTQCSQTGDSERQRNKKIRLLQGLMQSILFQKHCVCACIFM